MDCTVEQLILKTDKPFLHVDYNEIIDENVVMLSQTDTKNDYFGHPVQLYEGLEVIGYQKDEDINGIRDDIIMKGICIPNETESFRHVKWLLKANEKGIWNISEILKEE